MNLGPAAERLASRGGESRRRGFPKADYNLDALGVVWVGSRISRATVTDGSDLDRRLTAPMPAFHFTSTSRPAGCGPFGLDVAVDFRPRFPGWFALAGDEVRDLPFEGPRDILADVLAAAMGVHQDPLEEIVLEVDGPSRAPPLPPANVRKIPVRSPTMATDFVARVGENGLGLGVDLTRVVERLGDFLTDSHAAPQPTQRCIKKEHPRPRNSSSSDACRNKYLRASSDSRLAQQGLPVVDVRVEKPPTQHLEVFEIANRLNVTADSFVGIAEADLPLKNQQPLSLTDPALVPAFFQNPLIRRRFPHGLNSLQKLKRHFVRVP